MILSLADIDMAIEQVQYDLHVLCILLVSRTWRHWKIMVNLSSSHLCDIGQVSRSI